MILMALLSYLHRNFIKVNVSRSTTFLHFKDWVNFKFPVFLFKFNSLQLETYHCIDSKKGQIIVGKICRRKMASHHQMSNFRLSLFRQASLLGFSSKCHRFKKNFWKDSYRLREKYLTRAGVWGTTLYCRSLSCQMKSCRSKKCRNVWKW
jgi:hypothetical protein